MSRSKRHVIPPKIKSRLCASEPSLQASSRAQQTIPSNPAHCRQLPDSKHHHVRVTHEPLPELRNPTRGQKVRGQPCCLCRDQIRSSQQPITIITDVTLPRRPTETTQPLRPLQPQSLCSHCCERHDHCENRRPVLCRNDAVSTPPKQRSCPICHRPRSHLVKTVHHLEPDVAAETACPLTVFDVPCQQRRGRFTHPAGTPPTMCGWNQGHTPSTQACAG